MMPCYRRWTGLTVLAVLIAACTAVPGASDVPPGTPSASADSSSTAATPTAATPSLDANPSLNPPIDRDVAPPEVMGRTFLAELADGITVVGRVGLKERLVVPAGSFAFFDRNGTVIISTPGTRDTELS